MEVTPLLMILVQKIVAMEEILVFYHVTMVIIEMEMVVPQLEKSRQVSHVLWIQHNLINDMKYVVTVTILGIWIEMMEIWWMGMAVIVIVKLKQVGDVHMGIQLQQILVGKLYLLLLHTIYILIIVN